MQLREQIERSAKEARDKAFAQAREEHERVMDEAAAQVEVKMAAQATQTKAMVR